MTKFCWFEYTSTDAQKAQGFFGELFGWTVRDVPMSGGTYQMIAAGDTTIGGYRSPPEKGPKNAQWLSHLKVENAAASAAKAQQLGGKILMDAFKLGESGTMAVIADVAGAPLALWQPAAKEGPAPSSAVGRFCWNELYAPDPPNAAEFYAGLAGWTGEAKEMPGIGQYTVLSSGTEMVAGLMKPMMPGAPYAWVPYVAVAKCDAAAEKAKRLGAKLHVPPTSVPGVGRFAILGDPQGAGIGILQAE
ncbi:VOC family protein [soil metagenome]